MVVILYSIYDRVSGVYSEPFCALKDELAVRRFNYLMDNSKMVAADCELYSIAKMSFDTGEIFTFPNPEFICKYEVKC